MFNLGFMNRELISIKACNGSLYNMYYYVCSNNRNFSYAIRNVFFKLFVIILRLYAPLKCKICALLL